MNDYEPNNTYPQVPGNDYDAYPLEDGPVTHTRTRNLRIALFGVILTTIPFYLIGVVLLVLQAATPGQDNNANLAETTTVTSTPIGGELTATNTLRPTQTRDASPTPRGNVGPTPGQFVPPPAATNTLIPTVFVPPTDTPAPTLTPIPDDDDDDGEQPTAEPTLAPATRTPTPTLTDTPIPAPTDTPIPVPTEEPPAEEPPAEEPPADTTASETTENPQTESEGTNE